MQYKDSTKNTEKPPTLSYNTIQEGPETLEKIKLDIAQHVYDLRASTSRTQEEFGELVEVDPNIIDDLEQSDYEGDSFAVLAHIEKEVRKHVAAFTFPVKAAYPNTLFTTTITGFKLRLFRHHPGRTTYKTASRKLLSFDSEMPEDRQHLLNELAPWKYALDLNKQELKMFALAGLSEWCHLDDGMRANFSGNPNEYIHAVDTHTQLIDALIHYLETGERTAFKQWQQDMGAQEESRYLTELETALQHKTFEAFPDAEWLAQTLTAFVRTHAVENIDAR